MNELIYGNILLKIGNIGTPGKVQSEIENLNKILKNVGTCFGAIIIVIGVIKMIMALSEESPMEKQKSSLMIGIGIFFISMNQVLKTLNLSNLSSGDKGGKQIAANILDVIGTMLSYSGGILAMISIIMLIMAFVQESADQQASAVKLLTTSIGLLATNAFIKAIKVSLNSNKSANTYMSNIIGFIADVASYCGGGFVIVGVYRLVLSIRNEDSKERDGAIRLLIAGIALVSINIILNKFFGFSLRNTAFR